MRYMLDTNVISDLIRNPKGDMAARIAEVGEQNILTSIIVAAELRYGAAKRQSPRLMERLDTILALIEIAAFEAPAEMIYGELRARLETRGTPIGSNDMLIAAHALSLGCTLVTGNEREFSRIDDLPVQNWLAHR